MPRPRNTVSFAHGACGGCACEARAPGVTGRALWGRGVGAWSEQTFVRNAAGAGEIATMNSEG